jgi:DNA modification methylase
VTPYYSDAYVTLYHGDAREVLPQVRADLIVTDPPYGIGADVRQAQRAGKQHGRAVVASRDYGHSDWDATPPPGWLFGLMLERAPLAVVWGGNYFPLPPARGWLVWDKDNGNNGYADCELAWSNLDTAVRRLRYRWMGMLQEPEVERDVREHPTQKPVAVMRWAIQQAPDECASILDPFAGSGTTLRAAKDLGRKAIGIEIEERYCEIAARRMAQEVLALA